MTIQINEQILSPENTGFYALLSGARLTQHNNLYHKFIYGVTSILLILG